MLDKDTNQTRKTGTRYWIGGYKGSKREQQF